MLKKLIKYDLKWIYKALIPFYILSLIFAILGRTISLINNSLLITVTTKICYAITISMIVSIIINNIMRFWARIIRNVYKDEAYLTHTLPVTKKEIMTAKILSLLITILTSTLVIAVSLFICYFSKENLDILKSLLNIATQTYDTTTIKLILSLLTIFTIETIFLSLVGLTAITYGYSKYDGKILKVTLLGAIIYIVLSIINLGLIYIFSLITPDVIDIFAKEIVNITIIKKVLYYIMIIYIIESILLYEASKRKLNQGVDIK